MAPVSDAVKKVVDNNATKEVVFLGPRLIAKIFGVSAPTLKAKGLKSTKGKYDLAEFWRVCREHVREKMNRDIEEALGGDLTAVELKVQKTTEEVRKLKIENDLKEGILIPADEAMIEWSRQLKAICDVLDGIPSLVKMENPDISQSVLDSVQRSVISARKKAAIAE